MKLLKDVRSYGRKGISSLGAFLHVKCTYPIVTLGAIVPVMPGRMRHIWYPSKRAEYVTDALLKTLPDVVVERDFTFELDPTGKRQEARTEDADSVRGMRISVCSITNLGFWGC